MLSQTAQYALRAVLHIAEHGAEHPVPVGDIAQALEVPRNYLSKTLHQLARAGVVVSTFGPGGGFRLASPPDALTLDVVVSPFDTAAERHCLLGRARCHDSDPCPAHERWKTISLQIQEFFARTTVAQLLESDGAGLLPPRASRRPAQRR
ncbi:MAG TPA: Rrf2 family transcriptional regulator [Gemmatimonadaceae bacterium]|nr:Rrf2 family transcriptional regulator [Gemmatimonadaceae bacterium]